MHSLLDIAERTQRGPKMEEKQWDMALYKKMTALVKRYDIKIPNDGAWFNMDDALVDRVFEAALEFMTDMGVYCITTNRIVKFSREEIMQAIAEAPNYIIMGEGRDQRYFTQKKTEGKEPLNFCPGHHSPFTEELGTLVVKNFAQIPRTDFIEGYNFTTTDGREIFGQPLEAYASRREISWMREGVRKAERPGMSIVFYPITTRGTSFLATLDPDYGLRRTDGVLLSLLPDVKMEHDLLTAALIMHDYGLYSLSGSFALAGGFCGGVEGAIIEGVCKPLGAMLVYRDYINYVGVEHVSTLAALKIPLQPLSWARSVVNQVLNTKTNTICMAWVIPTSGPATENNLLEIAFRSIEAQINGGNLYALRRSRAKMNAGQTPLESEWMLEVSDATLKAGMDRQSAGEVCWKIAKRLEGRTPIDGQTIQECYDLVNHKPLPHYDKLYRQIKEEMASYGLKFAW
jgi:methylamine---corrinoid protein Co-methyltransferase